MSKKLGDLGLNGIKLTFVLIFSNPNQAKLNHCAECWSDCLENVSTFNTTCRWAKKGHECTSWWPIKKIFHFSSFNSSFFGFLVEYLIGSTVFPLWSFLPPFSAKSCKVFFLFLDRPQMDWPPTSADSQSLGNGPTPLSYGLKEKRRKCLFYDQIWFRIWQWGQNLFTVFIKYLCKCKLI